jgi:hypothetical protein
VGYESTLLLQLEQIGVCCFYFPESGSKMSTSPKAGKSGKAKEDDLGLWVDSTLISRLHRQPSKSLSTMILPDSERMLHYADLAFGTVKPDKFQSKKVLKTRNEK